MCLQGSNARASLVAPRTPPSKPFSPLQHRLETCESMPVFAGSPLRLTSTPVASPHWHLYAPIIQHLIKRLANSTKTKGRRSRPRQRSRHHCHRRRKAALRRVANTCWKTKGITGMYSLYLIIPLGVALLRSRSCDAAFLRLGVTIGSLELTFSRREGVSGVGCFRCRT